MKDWVGNNKSTYVMLGASNHTNKERQNADLILGKVRDLLDKEDNKNE